MSLPPYVPPTEAEWNALHIRLGDYISAYGRLSNAAGVNEDLCYHERALASIEEMKNRLHCLRIAVGS